jgi:hypothetical protein
MKLYSSTRYRNLSTGHFKLKPPQKKIKEKCSFCSFLKQIFILDENARKFIDWKNCISRTRI